MATLFNTKIKDTYQSLLKLEDNTILTTTSKNITDGLGNASPLYLSTTQVRIGSNSASAMYWDNTNNRLGIGTNAPTSRLQVVTDDATNPQAFSNQTSILAGTASQGALISAFSSTNGAFLNALYPGNAWFKMNYGGTNHNFSVAGTVTAVIDSNTTIGNGTTTLGAKLGIKGSGSTSATTSLLVQNSVGTTALSVNDASNVLVGTTTDNGYKLNVNGSINIAGGNKLNFSNGSAQCWITNEGLTGLGSRSILIPGTGGGGGFVFYSDGGGPITSYDASGDSIQIRAGSSAITGIMSINKSAASGYGGGTFIYYQTNSNNRMYTFGNPNNERGDESGTHTKIAAGAAGFLGNGGHVYLEAGAKGTQVGSVDGNIIIAATRGNVAIGLTTPTARLQVQGSGSTSATTSLLVQNSGGTNLLQQKDNGDLLIGTTASGLGTIYVPHSSSYGDRVFLAIQNGFNLLSTRSNAELLINGSRFWGGSLTLTANDSGVTGLVSNQTNATSVVLSGSVNAYNGTSQNDACSLVYIQNRGTTLQAAGSINWLKMDGNVNEAGGGGNKWCTGIYYNPSFTGGTLLANSHYCYHATSGQMMVNTTSPNASAQLQVDSTTRGFLPPRVTTIQKNAIATPAEGLMVYDTDLKRPCFFNGTSWITL